MRIYYLANARMPSERAHGIQIAKMSEALRSAGADVTLVVPCRGSGGSLKGFYHLASDIPVVRLPVIPYASFLLGSVSFMLLAFFFLWAKKLRGEKFLVYTIDMDQFSFALIPFLGVVYFVEIHDAKPRGALFSLLFRRAVGVLTINHIIKKKLCERFGISPDRVSVAPNGIDLEKFKIQKAKVKSDEEKKIALSTGQFYDWKGLDIIPRVARLLPDVAFVLVGGTKEEFVRLTGISDIPRNVEFVGKRPYPEIPRWLARADALFVVGTKQNEYSYYHTSPMKLFEYLPANRPIVAARTPAIADMVSEKEVFFYEPDNAESMVQAIQGALTDTDAASAKTSAARALAEKYSWRERARQVIEYLAPMM